MDRFEFRLENVAESVRGAKVTPEFFETVKPAAWLGRLFAPEEYQLNGDRVVVLAFSLWQQRLGGDPAVVGRAVQLNGADFQVVGILPQGFDRPAGAELWLPLSVRN
jgi:putative ABC transport system permease protein